MNFWIFVGIAVVAIGIALVWVLPPLLRTPKSHASERRAMNIAVYRDQLKELEAERANGALSDEQFEQSKLELEDRLSEDALQDAAVATAVDRGGRWVGWTVAGALPVLALTIYVLRGTPEILIQPALASAPAQQGPHAGGGDMAANMAQIEAELGKLQKAAEADPKNGSAWLKWGMANLAMERFPVAVVALKKATELLPNEAAVWAYYAEAIALAANRNLEGEPIRLLRHALELNPREPKALELAGIHAYQNKNWAQAAYYWRSLVKQMSDEEKQSAYGQNIIEAERDARGKAEAGLAALTQPGNEPVKPKAKTKAAAGPRIEGRVELAAALKDKVHPEDTIFLFARAGESGPPLAVMKARASALPLDFVLDDSMAMTPDMALSKVPEVVLVARVSKSGQPKSAAGDLEGKLSAVKVGAKGIKLVIDRVHP